MDQEEIERSMNEMNLANASQENSSRAAQYFLQEQEKGMADTQLDVDKIKERIYHRLKQDKYTEVEPGRFVWKPIMNIKDRIYSDGGVDKIMSILDFYVNKDILLSNFSEEQIKNIMLKYITELNDQILLKYQVIFREPTFEECREIILGQIEDKKKMRMFALELVGKVGDEKEITKELIKDIEKNIEHKMEEVRIEKRKENLRDYGLLIRQLEVVVLATLNRAYRGEERGSLRRHMNVSEIYSPKNQMPSQKEGGFMGWGRR